MGNNTEIFQIATEDQYRWAQATLNQRNRPPLMLRLLMRAFETYRGARKYGWSRPWNKYNVLNFQSFKLRPMEDRVLIGFAADILNLISDEMPTGAQDFCERLLSDRHLMGFIFVHEVTDHDARHEGATLSLGRLNGRRHRDRLDIVLESRVEGDISTGLSRIRIFVDPYRETDKALLWTKIVDHDLPDAAIRLFDHLSVISKTWHNDPQRIWQHWTLDYIDYFGDRKWNLSKSHFFSHIDSNDADVKKVAC